MPPGILVGQDGRLLTILIFGWGRRVGKRRLDRDGERGALCLFIADYWEGDKMGGRGGRYGENACRILVGKYEGNSFFIVKPTRCTNFTNLFCHETLHVSDSSSVHHQEFIHCTPRNGICHTGL